MDDNGDERLPAEDLDATERAAADPAAHWEQRYASRGSVWSGRVNRTLVDVAGNLSPGSALDLGCGEGADAIWLAERGWSVTGVDLSPTAARRATDAARAAGIGEDRARFVAADLTAWSPERSVDLVAATFLHSMVELPRAAILRRAATWVAPGGHLLVIAHAAAPPWAAGLREHAHEHRQAFPTPASEIADLDLDEREWVVRIAEIRTRAATGPSGEEADLEDSVLLVQRR
ncbi:class I SAM-dependent methyltransferase [Microbacterium limosum]|uniref:Class I SAM-dependent methyltransferase n=1 Tax=Microbacterium limosum TaxID=3079935 RepID=A0AAU0MH68_9MICO|nr:class I SAM-dependent methyltransferase [Microbacterium sp. Y20]WOQ69601.1 class I SAM-dependent methyltransferase [Microbacterium sp. Y20]